MANLVLACPICLQKIRAPSSVVGKQVRCPQCKNGFTAVDPNAVASEPALSVPRPAASEPAAADPLGLEADIEATAVTGAGSSFIDFLLLRRMITPAILVALFWFGVAVILLAGLVTVIVAVAGMATKATSVLPGLLTLLIDFVVTISALVLWRVICETIATVFRTAREESSRGA